MSSGKIISLIIALGLLAFTVYHFIIGYIFWAVLKLLISIGLLFTVFSRHRSGLIIFGHIAIVAGSILLTAGMYYIPFTTEAIKNNQGQISLGLIFGLPLFWGFISILGGICAIYHGFCKCVRREWH